MLARARGSATAALAAARHEAAGHEARLVAARAAADRTRHDLAERRRRRRAELDAAWRSARQTALGRLTELVGQHSRGAAGLDWTDWRPDESAGAALPGLYRIGTLTIPAAEPATGAEPRIGAEPPGAAPENSAGTLPALVPLLDQGHLVVAPDRARAAAALGVIGTVLLRVLGTAPPGSVRLTVYDPDHLGGSLASFAPLAPAGLLTSVGPTGLTEVLDELVEHVRRINEQVLAGDHGSVRELAARTGRRPEPWRIAILLGGSTELSAHQAAQLERLVRTGAACGVHLVASGIDLAEHPTVERIQLPAGTTGARTSLTGEAYPVQLDPPPPAELIGPTCRRIGDRVAAGPAPAAFAGLVPERLWTESSATALVAPIGEGTDGRLVTVELGDAPPHALIGGPSGSGKTNLLYAWIGALAARYGPDELELYLLDFKEGVSFAKFTPGRKDPSWLPQVRLAGINVNTDREYGIALLEFLHAELRRRAEAAKWHEAVKLSELRAEDPTGRWPRIVAVVDEFQVLLAGRDAVAGQAVRLLEDLARRGRSQGIHLVLASQDVTGIEALWGRSALIAQFTLRIALPKARRILAEQNTAAEEITRYHAVVNADSGAAPANRIVRIPDAGTPDSVTALQRRLWRMRPADLPEPRLFDGDLVPRLVDAPEFVALTPSSRPAAARGAAPVALVGQAIDVTGRSAGFRLTRTPGRNLAVLGSRSDEAVDVLASAVESLARQHPPGTARFSVACLDDDAVAASAVLVDELCTAGHDGTWYDRDSVAALLTTAAADLAEREAGAAMEPHYLVLYAVDAVSARPGARDQLRTLVNRGPELRVHLLAWWRSVPRLREDLGGVGARLDGIGGWLALDVHGNELTALSPQVGGPAWYPRVRRALFFDRAAHRVPQVVIPYRAGTTTAVTEATADARPGYGEAAR